MTPRDAFRALNGWHRLQLRNATWSTRRPGRAHAQARQALDMTASRYLGDLAAWMDLQEAALDCAIAQVPLGARF